MSDSSAMSEPRHSDSKRPGSTQSSVHSKPILPLVAGGGKGLLTASIDRYKGLAWWLAHKQMGEHAEDAVQEIFFNTWHNAAAFDPKRTDEVVFVTAVARQTLAHLRRQFGAVASASVEPTGLTETMALSESVLPDTKLSPETVTVVAAVLTDQLSESEREVLHLSFHVACPHTEIAQHLAISMGEVRNRLRSALDKVHAVLHGDQSGASEPSRESPFSSLPPQSGGDQTRFETLLLDEVTQGLGPAEHNELTLLLGETAGTRTAPDEPEENLSDMLHVTAALVELGFLALARTQTPNHSSSHMPVLVEADLRKLATKEARRNARGLSVPFVQARVTTLGLSPAWWIAAAALFLALLAWWPHLPFTNIVVAP